MPRTTKDTRFDPGVEGPCRHNSQNGGRSDGDAPEAGWRSTGELRGLSDAPPDNESDRAIEQGIQAKNGADGDRGRGSLGLHATRLRGDEDGGVVEERSVSKLRVSEAQALRWLFHTRKLTRPNFGVERLTYGSERAWG